MLKVIKIGGNIVDNPEKLDQFLINFAALQGPKILVHGGGKIASSLSKTLGIEPQMIQGRRVTDAKTLRIVTMVYAGLINKTIVAKLGTLGGPTLGISGADGRLIPAQKRNPQPIDFGFVGDPLPEMVNTVLLENLLQQGYTLVVAPITADSTGQLLNTNADTVAQTLATALAKNQPTELIYCFEKAGVLRTVSDENSLIHTITPTLFEHLKAAGIVDSGMLPKLENAFKAINHGVSNVFICSAERINCKGYGGTLLQKE